MANGILKGKRGIIFGALDDKSIATFVAKNCVAEGAKIVLTNAPAALRLGGLKEIAAELNAPIIPADATNMEDLENLISKSMDELGGKIDFILHSIGMSMNVRKGNSFTELNYDFMHKTYDVSAISFHRVMQTAYKLDAMNEWGSIVALSYMAAQRVFPDYNEMAEAKALLESFARSFGYHYAKKNHVRVNTISQSPTITTAGSGVKGFEEFFNYSDTMSPLGNASANSCAKYCVTLFSDYTKMVTMQNLFHDGGFSSMGMEAALVRK